MDTVRAVPAEADEFEVRLSVTVRFPAFNDREAARRRAQVFTVLEKLVPFVRRKVRMRLSYEMSECARTGKRVPYS